MFTEIMDENITPRKITAFLQSALLTQKDVQQTRLQAAEYLLMNSTKSIDSIAEEIGYHNKGYFYKIFQARYGMTPSRYRKKER